MTTLNAIGFTTAGSSVVAIFAFTCFSVAVRTANPKISPRCTARAPETVFNPKARRKTKIRKTVTNFLCCWMKKKSGKKKTDMMENNSRHGRKNDHSGGDLIGNDGGEDGDEEDMTEEEEDNNPIHVQYRGGPMFGWMFWTMSLSYEQLLKGVPGTGTRKNGMEGSMLKVNLDGIVLLRFHGEKYLCVFYVETLSFIDALAQSFVLPPMIISHLSSDGLCRDNPCIMCCLAN